MTGAQPLVSVVVPVFNGEKYVAEAIDSILAQDYPALEIIVIDDGSSDRTLNILSSYGNRIRVLQQANKGSAAARNLGVASATGAYIAFLDADDYWFPGKVGQQVAALQATGCRMAYSNFKFWHAVDEVWPQPSKMLAAQDAPAFGSVEKRWVYADLLLDCLVWTSTVMVEKAVLLAVGGFDEQLRKGQDYDLWLRLSRVVEMAAMPWVTALYRIHGESITHAPNARCFEYEIITNAVRRWGVAGPDGRSHGQKTVVKRIRRAALNFAANHWRWGDPDIGLAFLKRLRREFGLGPAGTVLYLRMLASKQKYRGGVHPTYRQGQ